MLLVPPADGVLVKLSITAAVGAAVLVAAMAVSGAPASATESSPRTQGTHAQPARTKPLITGAVSFDAPLGEEGGISNPQVSCGNDWLVEPKVTWTLTSRDTGESQTFTGTGGYPNQWFPRVPPGRYSSEVTAGCRGVTDSRQQKLKVGEKTAETTVSRSEWNQIEVGMTTSQVRQIVGYGGTTATPFQGTISRTYDLMPFWRWSVVEYRAGRVIKKYWNVGHD